MSTVLRVWTHIYGVSKDIGGKTFIFSINLGMWPLKSIISEKEPCSEGFNTHLWCFQGHRWENMNFSTKPRHVTPQIDCLGETNTVLRVSTHIYGVSKEIDGKTFIFRSKPRHVTPQIDPLGKMNQNMHSQPPVASQHKKTNKVVWTYEDDWPPKRTSTYERPFTWEGNYLVIICPSIPPLF